MPEALSRQSALAEVYQTGRFGLEHQPPGIIIQQLQGLSIIQIAAYPDTAEKARQVLASTCGLAPAEKPRQAAMQGHTRMLWNGPQRWWLVQAEDAARVVHLREELGTDAAVTEHSHGRVVLRLSGPAIRDLLAKGSAVDFHPTHFKTGWSRPLALDHFDVQLHCLDESANMDIHAGINVDIYIARSLAVSFWEWLVDAAGEFGGEVLPSGLHKP